MKLTQPLPPRNHFAILEAFSLLYEDLDLQLVESKLIEFICFTFGFDRTAFFFVKHKKNVLQGKQGCGFEPGVIEDIQVELSPGASLAAPLLSGAPLRSEGGKDEAWKRGLNLTNYVLVPIVNRKHAACWEQRNCAKTDCPVYRNKWMHCWLLPDFVCCERQDTSGERRALSCEMCPVYAEKNLASMEGVLLVDNSLSGEPIPEDTVVTLSIIAHAVGRAINNSKLFNRAVHEAINDFLTGLYNRRYFNNRVEEEINRAERYGEPLCLVFADIDHFKDVNDRHGHAFGDAVLRRIGAVLKRDLRKGDVAARHGGEEFALLLTNTAGHEALLVAEKLRAAVENERFPEEDPAIRITMSFGVAELGGDIFTSDQLLAAADRALYAAKRNGRNRVETFRP